MAQTINVDSKPALFMPTLYYSQGDVGRTFEIVVSSSDGFTIPSGATCQMVATKPSGLGFTVAGTVSGNKVTFTTTAVMTDEWGRFPAELRITSGNTVIGTANFYMEGERNPHPDGTTDGQQEQLIPELTLLVERAENAAQTATDDAIEAASATIDEVLNYLPTEVTNLKSEIIRCGQYDWSVIKKPFDARILGAYRTGGALDYEDSFFESSRALFPISDGNIKRNSLAVYNPQKYLIAIYSRRKSDNLYVGYVVEATATPCISLTNLDTNAYTYTVMVIHKTGETETNWTRSELSEMAQNVCICTGRFNDNQEELSLIVDSNLITSDIVHVGKYYWGSSEPSANPNMAYTDLIPVKEGRAYYFPYLTIGYSWYHADGVTVLGGDYIAVEQVAERSAYLILDAPIGASFIGVSVRAGDAENMVLSELPNSKAKASKVSTVPVAESKVVREPLNWLYSMDFKRNTGGSRLLVSGGNFDGGKVRLSDGNEIASMDQICMDKSKTDVVFSIPSGSTPSFFLGINGYYAQTSLAIADGAIGVWFKSDGTAEVRMGTGQGGAFPTLLATFDIAELNITNGRTFVMSLEKDTISKYIITLYDALTPNRVASVTIEASPNSQDANLYNGQVRGWGGPYVQVFGGLLDVYKVQMYSTAPTYPKVGIWGDSYVENMGRNPNCGYANLIRTALGGDAYLSGQGGATALQTSYRFGAEINTCKPQYVIFNVGVNDSFNGSVDNFKTALQKLIGMAEGNGSVPILTTVPNVPAGNSTTQEFCNTVNPWIRSLGYDYIDIAYALSTGDGITGDTNKFVSDQTHPNLAGGQAIFNYIKAFLPYLLWK